MDEEEEVELSRAYVIRDYIGKSDGELDLFVGEVIEDVKFDEIKSSGRSRRSGHTGTFLTDHVQEINRFDPEDGSFRWNVRAEVTFNYGRKSPNELEIRVGDVLIVKELSDNDWLLGELEGHGIVGYFPRNYVRVLDDEEESQDHEDGGGNSRNLILDALSTYRSQSTLIIQSLVMSHESQKRAIMDEIKRYRDEEQRKYSLHVERLIKELKVRDEDIKKLKFENSNLKVKMSTLESSAPRPAAPKTLPKRLAPPPLPTTMSPGQRPMAYTPPVRAQPVVPVWSFPVPRMDRAEVIKTPIPDSVASIQIEIDDDNNMKPNITEAEESISFQEKIRRAASPSVELKKPLDNVAQQDFNVETKENFDEKKNFWKQFQK